MAELVRIGRGRKTHYRADGTGVVPAGRSRCEVDKNGKYLPYYSLGTRVESPVHAAHSGEPTCYWCLNRILRDGGADDLAAA